MDIAGFLGPDPKLHAIFREIRAALPSAEGIDIRVSKSQIGFYRKRPFASVWKPTQYLEGTRPALVLTIFLNRRNPSERWKQVVEPGRGHFTHHLELVAPGEVDEEVRQWLAEAWAAAGSGTT